MSNPLVNKPETPDIKGMFNDFKSNPMEFLAKTKFNIPDNVGSDPQAVIQHLLNSGQITQQQVNALQSKLSWLRQFFN